MTTQTLILIDVQRGFSDPVWGERGNPAFEGNITRLLASWRRRSWPIVHIRHDSRRPASPLRPGQAGNDFMPCAAPAEGEPILAKTVNSAFIGTDLSTLLVRGGHRNLVFAGLTTDHCVSTSTRMAANLGFTATVAHDATAAFARQGLDGRVFEPDLVHRVALASLAGEFAELVSTAALASL